MADQRMLNVQARWQDWGNLILALWLFISPWVLQFAPASAGGGDAAMMAAASWNAWIIAVIIGVFSVAALVKPLALEEWVNIFAGAWLFIAPWILSFGPLPAAMWNALIVGAVVFVLAVWDLNNMPTAAHRGV